MDVQKYIDKMVLVPFERWNQLLAIEQKTLDNSEHKDKTIIDSQEPEGNINAELNDNTEDSEKLNALQGLPPPGIPMNEIEFDKPKKPKKQKRHLKHADSDKKSHKQRKKEISMVGWLSLP